MIGCFGCFFYRSGLGLLFLGNFVCWEVVGVEGEEFFLWVVLLRRKLKFNLIIIFIILLDLSLKEFRYLRYELIKIIFYFFFEFRIK